MRTNLRDRDITFRHEDGCLVRTVRSVDGRTYTHRCSLEAFERVAWVLEETPADGNGVSLSVRVGGRAPRAVAVGEGKRPPAEVEYWITASASAVFVAPSFTAAPVTKSQPRRTRTIGRRIRPRPEKKLFIWTGIRILIPESYYPPLREIIGDH